MNARTDIAPRFLSLSLPMDQYVGDPAPDHFEGVRASLNASIAKTLLAESPLHAWTSHPRLNPHHETSDPTKFDIGRVAHKMVIEGNEDGIVVVDANDWRTKAAKEEREAAIDAGKIPVLEDQYIEVKQMVLAARQFIAATDELRALMHEGVAEQVWMWEESPGIVCRCRPDWWSPKNRTVVDYKTTAASAHPARWSQSTMQQIGADIQGAMYRRALRAKGVHLGAQIFLVQETTAPYACSAIALTETAFSIAEDKLQTALDLWTKCLGANQWPGYPQRIAWADPPAWAAAQWEEAKVTGLDFYDRLFGRTA
jgi:hypothetical protein